MNLNKYLLELFENDELEEMDFAIDSADAKKKPLSIIQDDDDENFGSEN